MTDDAAIAKAKEMGFLRASDGVTMNRDRLLADAKARALALVDGLWRELGADVEHMDVQHHDQVLAATSHLPHLLAFTLVDSLAKRSENLEIFRYAAGGFRDFTRIAASGQAGGDRLF